MMLGLLGTLLYAELLVQPACGNNGKTETTDSGQQQDPVDATTSPDGAGGGDSGMDGGNTGQCMIKPGSYMCVATMYTDPAGHRMYIGDVFPKIVTVGLQGMNMSCTAGTPFVNVTGTCPGTLSGKGTVAGYPNVTCEMQNMTPMGQGWTANYVMGSMGELPQGKSMTIDITCMPGG